MTHATTSAAGFAAVLAAVLAAAACTEKKDPVAQVKEEVETAPDLDPVKIEVTVANAAVAPGDEIVFHVKLTNKGKDTVKATLPRLDQRSISFLVKGPNGTQGTVTRIHGEPMPTGKWNFEPMDAKDLAPGESVEGDVSTLAVQAGTLTYATQYYRAGAPAVRTAPGIEVKVTPADAARPNLGVTMETTHGTYTAKFRPDVAFNTCESFATLTKKGFFTGLKFHRIIKGFMAQGGDPKGDGSGGPGYSIPLEATVPVKLRHTRGVMSMGRTGLPRIGQDTAGCQFFLMFAKNPSLDRDFPQGDSFGYTTFAEMTEGEDALKRLENVPTTRNPMDPQASPPAELVQIKAARLVMLP
jgi:peptidyl-prolyl cis-trans isomerase B (cyclophilin B)